MADGIDERNGVRKKEVLQQLVSEEEVQAMYCSNSNSSYSKVFWFGIIRQMVFSL